MSPKRQKRSFEDKPAKRGNMPLLIGLYGPSGCGKTLSALRLAYGMRRVVGGTVGVIDTEHHRAEQYAERFDPRFRHVDLTAPFSPLDYLDAIEHFVARGIRILVVDSMTHEHEGQGGVIEMHAAEMQRMNGGREEGMDRYQYPAWSKPKAQRRKLLNAITQLGISAIFCFRSKEKLKLPKKGSREKDVIDLGWMPIAGEEFPFEMTVNLMLPPGARGVPELTASTVGDRVMMKIPDEVLPILSGGNPLSEETGEQLARWASGGKAPEYGEVLTAIQAAETEAELREAMARGAGGDWSEEERAALRGAAQASHKRIETGATTGETEKPGRSDPAAPDDELGQDLDEPPEEPPDDPRPAGEPEGRRLEEGEPWPEAEEARRR